MFEMQLFSAEPIVHLRVVQLIPNFGSKPKIGFYFQPFIILTNQALLCWRPPVVSSTLCHNIADRCC